MLKVTAQQRANAIEARDVLWPSVPPEKVVEGLNTWFTHCGTHACFGGWCAQHPPFMKQGVFVDMDYETVEVRGSAQMHLLDHEKTAFADKFLFGSWDMFDPRSEYVEADQGFTGTDHELVTHRLNWLIANSEVVDDAEH